MRRRSLPRRTQEPDVLRQVRVHRVPQQRSETRNPRRKTREREEEGRKTSKTKVADGTYRAKRSPDRREGFGKNPAGFFRLARVIRPKPR